MNLWEKVGNLSTVGELSHILFRGSSDSGSKIGEEPIRISHNWYVWQINEKTRKVGTLTGKYRKAELGIIVTPHDIVERIKTGNYSFFYPGFE